MKAGFWQFWTGMGAGLALAAVVVAVRLSQGISVPQAVMARFVASTTTAVLVQHRRAVLRLAESQLDPVVRRQISGVSKRVFVEVEGQRVFLPKKAAVGIDRALYAQARTWIDEDLRDLLGAPARFVPALARMTTQTLNHRSLPFTMGPLYWHVPIRIQPKSPSKSRQR